MRYQLTQADRRKGGKAKYAKYGHTGHKLTAKDASKGGFAQPREAKRRGGLATAAKRRAKRLMDLLRAAGDAGVNAGPPDQEPAQRGSTQPQPEGPATLEEQQRWGWPLPEEAGESLASKLLAERIPFDGEAKIEKVMINPPPPSVDPFTLSALKRFRLCPLSPLALTRSQRAQVDVMVKDGWLEADSVSMLRLTEKGRQAIEEES